MATIKSYTTIEQSKKLAEILPIESADMCWTNHYYGIVRSSMTISAKSIYEYKKLLEIFADSRETDVFYPCWSLAALLELLPKRLEIMDNVYELSVYFYGLYYWNIVNGNPCFEFKDKDNLVDACVAMIEKLHELNLL